MKKKDIEDAVLRELDQWPMVEHRFDGSGKHPRVVLEFCGLERFVVYPSTPSDDRSLDNTLAEVRRELKEMGAARNKPPKAEARPHRPGNDGAEKRPDPVQRELVEAKPSVAERLEALIPHGGRITEPGIYDLPDDVYHADPCATPSLSGSISKGMWDRTPWHGWTAHPKNPGFQPKEEDKFSLGKTFHKQILGKGAELAVADFKDWRTNDAKAFKKEAIAAGQTPVLKEQYERSLKMAEAARWQLRGWEELAFAMAGGSPEKVLIWNEDTPWGTIQCRAMVDWMPHAGIYWPDWKSTAVGAGPDEWGARTMWDIGCDIQEAFTRRGVQKLRGFDPTMIFAVVETDEPHALAVHQVHPAYRDDAMQKVEWAIGVWAMCLQSGRWPGYPRQIAYQEPPTWKRTVFENRRDNGVLEHNFWEDLIAGSHTVEKSTDRIASDTADAFGLEPLKEETDGV